MAKKDVKSDEIINYYKNIGREETAKRILEDPEYAEKMQKLSLDDNLRKKIAKKGWIKYHKYFNSQIVSDYMLN